MGFRTIDYRILKHASRLYAVTADYPRQAPGGEKQGVHILEVFNFADKIKIKIYHYLLFNVKSEF